jgi:diguanylate cyclase (GGDEF)-like protein/PAS domain S-box-containing protein
MSLAVFAWITAVALIACAATAFLWRGSADAQPFVKTAYHWLAAAAALWGGSFVLGEALPGQGLAASLTVAGLLALAALAALGAGVLSISQAGRQDAGSAGQLACGTRATATQLADGGLLAAALFVICWAAFYGGAYHRLDVSAGAFALDLIRPVAELVVLGAVLVYVGRAWRSTLLPWLALLAVALSDSLAVPARVAGLHPGAWARLAQVTSLVLLAAVPLARSGPGWLRRPREIRGWPGASAGTAAIAATAAALTIIVWALAGGSVTEPAVVITGGFAVLVLVARIAAVAWRERTASEAWQDSGQAFRELAERTSDVVVLCDPDGIIRYASPAVARFGYRPETVEGTPLSALIHPEDRLRGARLARATTMGAPGQTTRLSCRVRSADGTWHHVESNLARHRRVGAPDQLLITARDVSDQVALRRQVTHLTFHDGLTGLPNRTYIEERAKSAAQRATGSLVPVAEAAAIFIDLDGFTGVNDSVGHGAGDLLLAQAARRLRNAVPAQHTVARWGGDEFAVLVEGAASAQETVDIAERLAGSIAGEPFRVADRDVSLTASVGVALADTDPPEHLMRNADVAMARAKETGGRVEVYAAHMHADVVRRLELASDLRRAITEEKLELEYQPVVELATSQVVGVEALVRWTREQTPVPPVEFLGVAEESGLIVALGEQVLRAACAQAAAWHASGWPTGISVNFSLRQVSTAGFADLVLSALSQSGLPPGALTLEVTERVLVEGAGSMVDALARLRRVGVKLAIDDFGTGYASLAYLRRLPVDIIKIDPSFVAGLGTDATLAMLTATIVRVGHDLGIEVVAEGIERSEQLEMLRAMGCGLGQGFLVARPMAARGIEAFAGRLRAGSGPNSRPPMPPAPAPGPVPGPEPVSVAEGMAGPEPVPGPEDMTARAPAPLADPRAVLSPDPGTVLSPDPGTVLSPEAGAVLSPEAGTVLSADPGTRPAPEAAAAS